jgi:hypothetical protein
MQKTYLLVQVSDNRIVGTITQDDPDAGPIYPQNGPGEGLMLAERPEGFTTVGRRETEVPYMIDGMVSWVDMAQLTDTIAQTIGVIDGAAEVARMEVISKQTNMPEYVRAEAQARAFKAAGYPADNVPSSVESWAEAKHRDNWTAQQAADDIIATADAWYGLLDAIRKLRLCAKEDVRHAITNEEALARAAQFDSDLKALMGQ